MTEPCLRQASFADLTGLEGYGLCRLRGDVLVVEQQCPYPDLDGRDLEPTTAHLWFEADGVPVATIRVLREQTGWAIGRVATAAGWRGRGLAGRVVAAGGALCGDEPIVLGAQAYLESWYERFGFRRTGPDYVED